MEVTKILSIIFRIILEKKLLGSNAITILIASYLDRKYLKNLFPGEYLKNTLKYLKKMYPAKIQLFEKFEQ